MRAQDEIAGYLTAIGGRATAGREVRPDVAPDVWWAQRIGELTTESDGACDDPARTAGELMIRIARVTAAGDRTGLHRQLVGAGAGLGSSLATEATTALRQLTTDVLGRPATADDVPAIVGRAPIADLLPGLPPRIASGLIVRACRLATTEFRHDPTDLAVGAVVIAARLAHHLGRDLPQAAGV